MVALKGEKALAELAQIYEVYQNQITTWGGARAQLAACAGRLFGGAPVVDVPPAVDWKSLQAAIGDLRLEIDFLSGALGKACLLRGKQNRPWP